MRGTDSVLDEKLGSGIAESGGSDEVAHWTSQRAVALAEVEACGFHSCTPFSTAASSSETFSRIEPPNL
jgi:hypothetical protein